jgi:hypothetical protein
MSWGTRIRTLIDGARNRRPAIRRSPKGSGSRRNGASRRVSRRAEITRTNVRVKHFFPSGCSIPDRQTRASLQGKVTVALDDGKEGSIFPASFSHQGRRVPKVLVLDDLGGQQGRLGFALWFEIWGPESPKALFAPIPTMSKTTTRKPS